jgi:Flp pilus assembly protein TadD
VSKIIKNKDDTMELSPKTVERVEAFLRGEMTWAQVKGMTFQEAASLARLGCDYADAGQLEEAKIIFEALVAGNPKDGASRAALGTVYQKLDRIPDAREQYDAALELDPTNPVALVNRGELRVKDGDKEGLRDLARAADADPKGTTSAGRRAAALVKAIALATAEQVHAAQSKEQKH